MKAILFKTLIFTVLVPGMVTVGIPYLLLSSGTVLLSFEIGIVRLAGAIPILLGVGIYLWCAYDFASVGQGTPAPIAAPRALVPSGLYRMVRNPMYISVLCVLTGEAIVFETGILLVYASLVWLATHLFVVYYEEPHLRKTFGNTYEAYCKAVHRWLPRIPGGEEKQLHERC